MDVEGTNSANRDSKICESRSRAVRGPDSGSSPDIILGCRSASRIFASGATHLMDHITSESEPGVRILSTGYPKN